MEKSIIEPAAAYNLAASIEVAEGGVVSKQIIKNNGGNITLFAFDAGQGLSEHTAPFDAIVQIVSGSALVTIGGKEQSVKEGEFIWMPANVPHALQAEEAFKMCLVMLKG